jgi:dipeptidyl aminopeptidase/acylaminoacyl peptidase
MSRYLSQVQTLRRLSRVYRRLLALAVPAAFAACQGAADPLAPDAAGDASAPAAAPATEAAPALADLVGALASNRIAFRAYTSDGGADIWTMDPQGGTLAHLTTFAGMEGDPHWSFDHKHIAFTRIRNGVSDIYLMDADGTHKHWARSATYSGDIDMPSWSPDGTHLLVRAVFQGLHCLAKIDLATGNLALVAPAGLFAVLGSYPMYDPADKTILYLDNTYKAIKRFTPGGAQTTVFTSSLAFGQPAISPDGTRLAYSAAVTITNSEIYVVNLATKVTKRLTYNSAADYTPSWSPDGTKLAFSSYRTPKLQVWTMNSSTGGSLTRITSRTYGATAPAWTR